jgi:dienelactone hydrolase
MAAALLAACAGDEASVIDAGGLRIGEMPGATVDVVAEYVTYEHDGTPLQGYLVHDPKIEGERPGVLVVHAWWGLDDFAKERADELARLGYVAFALDMYGKGKVTTDPKQAGAWAGQFRGEGVDPGFRRGRVRAGLDVLARSRLVDASRLGAIGFCFGGTTVLELAWSGAEVDAVVSFHGNPTTPSAEEAPGIRASILVCHGADDPLVKPERLRAFESAMRDAKADWQLVSYGSAVHSFTDPDADAHGIAGVGYNREAAERSWAQMRALFEEVFAE